MQDRISQPGIVTDPKRSQNRAVRKVMDETFALKREPYCRIAQPGSIARLNDCLTDMKVVSVRDR